MEVISQRKEMSDCFLLYIYILNWSIVLSFAAPEIVLFFQSYSIRQQSLNSSPPWLSLSLLRGPKCKSALPDHPCRPPGFRCNFPDALFRNREWGSSIHFRSPCLGSEHTPWLLSFTATLSLSTEVNQVSISACNIMSLLKKLYLPFLKNLK